MKQTEIKPMTIGEKYIATEVGVLVYIGYNWCGNEFLHQFMVDNNVIDMTEVEVKNLKPA